MQSEGGSNNKNYSHSFYLFFSKENISNVNILNVRFQSTGFNLAEAVLLVEAWSKEAKKHIQKPINDMNLFNPDELKKK